MWLLKTGKTFSVWHFNSLLPFQLFVCTIIYILRTSGEARTRVPLLEHLHRNKHLEQQNTKNLQGRKITACMCNYEQENTKRLQANCHFWGVRSKSWELHMVPAHSNAKVVGRFPGPALWPAPPMHPTLTPFRESVRPPQRANKNTCYLFLLLHPIARVPIKPCLNSFCGALLISVDWRVQGPKTLSIT